MRPQRLQNLRPQQPPDANTRRLLEERALLLAEVERLRQQNTQLLAELQETDVEQPAQPDAETLVRRIQELTQDLTRVQQRSALEVENARVAERARQLAGLGDVLDSVESVLAMTVEGATAAWRSGLLGIESQLHAYFRAEGASLTGEVGEPYDPALHEGVAMVTNSGVAPGHVAKVVRRGILLQDGHVARTAQVFIAG